MPKKSSRLERLPAYVFAVIGEKINALTQAGVDVIRLDIGNPDMPPPDEVISKLYTAASLEDSHGYSGYRGIKPFRVAVAEYYEKRFGVQLNSETEVLPLIGSKEGIVNLCLAYLDGDDIALIPEIGYPSYAQGARLTGSEIFWAPMKPDTYLIDFEQIPDDVAKKAKLLWLNYPNNPTGATATVEFYEEAVEFCRKYDIILASDNPYVEVTFDGYVAPSALQAKNAKECSVEFMSFSKSHNMAGWRLGAAVGSSEILKNLLQIKSNMDSGHFIAIYEAGITALKYTTQEWLDTRNATYQKRRDKILKFLPQIGLEAQKSKGSLYIWAKPTNNLSAEDYIESALEFAHVSLAPGAAYGPGGEGYIRISLGVHDDRLDQALVQLKEWYITKYG